MQTTSLLAIKANTHHSTDAMTGQALSMVSSKKDKTDGFKSAFNNHLDKKRNADVSSEKKLPHNGNDLPKKKLSAEKNDEKQHSKESDVRLKKTQHESSDSGNKTKLIDNDHVNSHEHANSHEQANSHEPANNEQAASRDQTDVQTNNSVQETNQQQQINSDADKSFEHTLINETVATEISISQQLQESTKDKLSGQQTIVEHFAGQLSEQLSGQAQQAELNDRMNTASLSNSEQVKPEISLDSSYYDKKNLAAEIKGQFDNKQAAANVLSQLAANTSSGDTKNESALTKNIAEFQQFIEMSRKHSMAGESIASVKLFELGMKNEQINTQLLFNDIKLPAAQLSSQTNQSAQILIPSVPLEKISSSLSFSQTLSSPGVKTPVGQSGWNQDFSRQIILLANNGIQQAKIKLNPMNLGPVEAMVRLSGETAVVNLTSMHLSTKEAMENAIPRLKEMLNENGFSQVDVNVSHQDKKQQQDAALGNNDGSNTGSNNEHGNSTMPGEEQLSEETLVSESDAQVSGLDEQGLNIVDYYA